MEQFRFVLYTMMSCQMAAWLWFSIKGGKLSDRSFLIFTIGMLLGQLGAGIETYWLKAWGAFAIQVFFFVFTAFAGLQRYRMMHATEETR